MKSFDFKFGATIYGRETDKSCGQLARLVIEPKNWTITDLILENGLLFKQSKVVPVSEVIEATAMGIRLAIDCQELTEYPSFSEMVVERNEQSPSWMTPAQSESIIGSPTAIFPPIITGISTIQEKVRQGVAEDKIILEDKVDVYGQDGRVGQLSHILTVDDDLDGQIQYLVITQGTLLTTQYIIPIQYVQTLSEQGIHVLASDEEIGEFPQYFASAGEM